MAATVELAVPTARDRLTGGTTSVRVGAYSSWERAVPNPPLRLRQPSLCGLPGRRVLQLAGTRPYHQVRVRKRARGSTLSGSLDVTSKYAPRHGA